MKTEFPVPKIGAKYLFKTGERARISGMAGYRGMGAIWEVKVGKETKPMSTQDLRFEVFGEYSLTPSNGDRFTKQN